MAEAHIESSTIDRATGNLVINAILVTSFDKIPKQFIFSPATPLKQVRASIKSYLDSLVSADTVAKTYPAGLFDLTPIDDDPPSDELKARRAFGSDVEKLKQYQRAVSLGFLATDDKAITELEASLKSRFVVEYLDLV